MRQFHLTGFAIAIACCIGSGASALECPLPQSVAKPGVIEEPQAVIAAMAPMFSGADVAQRAPEIVAQVRERYPSAGPAEIVNFLVTAYCPVANRQNISEAEKQGLVNAFAAAVTQQVY